MGGRALNPRKRSCHHGRAMRRAALVLWAVALTLAAVAVLLRRAPDVGRPPLAPNAGGLAREAPGTAPALSLIHI